MQEPSASAAAAQSAIAKSAPNEVQTIAENDLYRIIFTNRGGAVKSWILKKYKDDEGRP